MLSLENLESTLISRLSYGIILEVAEKSKNDSLFTNGFTDDFELGVKLSIAELLNV